MGERTGRPRGRPPGSPNKASVERQAAVAASGETPLDFLLRIMRTSEDEARAIDAAKAAAPYVHAKLSSVEVGNKDDKPFQNVKRIELVPVSPNADRDRTASDPG